MRRMASQPPQLDGFHFIRLLGSGGFSDVFLYEQELPKRSVAVKVLLTDSVDETARARFVAEANVMAQLSAHPYIVTIHHAGVSADERPYLVMEYCSGPSLADRLKRERIGVEDALRTGVRLSSAVATAHAAGILHRDIKPANVLTNALGWPALTDFGIASALEELPVHTTTLSDLRRSPADTGASGDRSVGLSVPWSPPEMFADDSSPDVRSDIFSLAATVHTLLAGRTPFEVPGRSNGTLDLMGRIERGMVTPIDRGDLPASLIASLRRGMALRREDRYQTAVDFARALQRVELELGLAPTSIDVPDLVLGAERPVAGSDDGGQETRARSVATIQAQPERAATARGRADTAAAGVASAAAHVPPAHLPPAPAAPAPAAPAPVAPAPAEPEPTRVRGVVPVEAQPSAPAPAAASADEHTMLRSPSRTATAGTGTGDTDDASPAADTAAPRDPRRRILAWVGAGAAAVVALGVTAAIVAGLVAPAPQPTETAGETGGPIAVTVVPAPTLVSAKRGADGTTATFTWKTADPQDGDQYTWVREGTTNPPTVTVRPTATVTGIAAGAPVCIDVSTIRAGRTSEPLKACAP